MVHRIAAASESIDRFSISLTEIRLPIAVTIKQSHLELRVFGKHKVIISRLDITLATTSTE
jgi:hypothetical protein